ncbi:hypothetical protein MXM41_04845 [Leclercia adecarboxylata]|uniref:hypothetical protein n=1 Tax=Leclercia adecarboxylata TaxID=83655 RepID=UPI002DB631A4|nr:hypothetical protein [Leclercia adecarboxylata]MEB6378266.1 hypothetical protein [Leclercia adecarboxylata]
MNKLTLLTAFVAFAATSAWAAGDDDIIYDSQGHPIRHDKQDDNPDSYHRSDDHGNRSSDDD